VICGKSVVFFSLLSFNNTADHHNINEISVVLNNIQVTPHPLTSFILYINVYVIQVIYKFIYQIKYQVLSHEI